MVFDRDLVFAHRRRALRAPRMGPVIRYLHEHLRARRSLIARRFERIGQIGGVVPVLEGTGCLLDNAAPATSLISGEAPRPWVVADEEYLPFAAQAFDLLIGCGHLHNVNDVPGVLLQLSHALRPDGALLGAVVGQGSLPELRAAMQDCDTRLLGGGAARLAPMIDVRTMGMLLLRAGFALPVTDVETVVMAYRDVPALLADLRASGLSASHRLRDSRPLSRAYRQELERVYCANFADSQGRVQATYQVVWYLGWAPSEDQPKPLRPGAGAVSLVDALAAIQPPPKTRDPS